MLFVPPLSRRRPLSRGRIIRHVWRAHVANVPQANAGVAFLVEKYLEYQKNGLQPLFPPEVIKACAIMTYDLRIDFVKLAGLVGITAINPIKLPF